ncbi:MAG: divalent-cation tolerance protein CutA [Elusimicrobia bacterium]|nr:divalent-cation tolerance protein CutA [Elusimicrobiota bacterium]
MGAYSVVLITVPTQKAGDTIARELVERRLAACVSSVPGVRSCYRWKGKIETAQERLLIAKTRSSLVGKLSECARALHPYSVPEVIALPIERGHRPYLDWIGASTPLAKAERTR